MKDLQIVATFHAHKADEKTGSITVKAPEDCDEAIRMFGKEPLFTNAMRNWVIGLQSNIRTALEKNEDPTVTQTRLGGSKMGVAASKATMDPTAALMAQFRAGTPEQRAEIRKALREEMAKAEKEEKEA